MTRAPDELGSTVVGLEPGDLLSGRYCLKRELGRGGMGVVWLATDQTLDCPVAIKLLPAPVARDRRAIARMKEEAKRCRKLSHPHIIPLHTFDQDDERGGIAYLVMAYLDGCSLSDLLVDYPKGVEAARVVAWAGQLADALDHAHERGVLHRDIKPANVMIGSDDRAYLVDFGIGREMKDTVTRFTGHDSSGTLLYMSPQQLAGESDVSNDVYSLAATLYEALSGEPPFTTGDIQHQILNRAPSPLSTVPPAVGTAVLAGLAKEVAQRPASASAMVAIMSHEGPVPTGPASGAPAAPEDPSPRVMRLMREAAAGDIDAQFHFAYCLLHDDGLDKDPTRAVEQFKIAAEGGHAEACEKLGFCYQYGIGVRQDMDQAARWYEAASKLVGKEPFIKGKLSRGDLRSILARTGGPEARKLRRKEFWETLGALALVVIGGGLVFTGAALVSRWFGWADPNLWTAFFVGLVAIPVLLVAIRFHDSVLGVFVGCIAIFSLGGGLVFAVLALVIRWIGWAEPSLWAAFKVGFWGGLIVLAIGFAVTLKENYLS